MTLVQASRLRGVKSATKAPILPEETQELQHVCRIYPWLLLVHRPDSDPPLWLRYRLVRQLLLTDPKALQRVMKTAECITGCPPLPSMQSIYHTRCQEVRGKDHEIRQPPKLWTIHNCCCGSDVTRTSAPPPHHKVTLM
ncbi:unnamed protein product [Boreogadus saida]